MFTHKQDNSFLRKTCTFVSPISPSGMKKIFFPVALIGLALGLLVHILSLLHIDVIDAVPYVWVLHAGIFITFGPALIGVIMSKEYRELEGGSIVNRMNPLKLLKVMFGHLPKWVFPILVLTFVYTFINFSLFMQSEKGSPSFMNGQYVLASHGQVLEVITEQQFHYYQANELRGFSGHWIFFYCISAAMLYPYKKNKPKLDSI